MKKCFMFFAIFFLALCSCDKEVGTKGIVVDNITGKRITNVAVTMKSQEQGSKTDTTDIHGFFDVFKSFSCGIASCNAKFKMTFIKDGYVPREIIENYEYTSEAEFVGEKPNDTLLVKLMPVAED